ncbi:MAG: alpha/beta hydrolase [Pseudomonadota bacterium]|nr:alpha/beta hydrolase [Pseudomonadota bacterium]
MTGDDDRVVPTKGGVRLAWEIDAPIRVIEACRHLPQEECSGRILEHHVDKV